jgi:hypothetical protein
MFMNAGEASESQDVLAPGFEFDPLGLVASTVDGIRERQWFGIVERADGVPQIASATSARLTIIPGICT